jgi:hypothetical protein
MNKEQQRKGFEQWLETVIYDNSNILSPQGLAWEAWQAASEQLTAARSEATHYEAVAQKAMDNLIAVREELAEWRILNGWGGTPEIINDFIKGQQTRIHYAQNLKEELTAVTEQRDKAWQKIENQAERITYLEGATNHATGTPLSKAIEQRDRLAEAMTRIINIYENPEKGCIPSSSDMYDEALQSLTTNNDR